VSHLHIPDGVLPLAVWAGGWAVAAVALVLAAQGGGRTPQRVAFRAAIGALALAAMAVELPLGPFEYHLTLAGPIGILLGVAGGYQVLFIATAMLAFIGHGGFTVIGLNALVLGSGAATARGVFALCRRRFPAPASMAAGTAVGQAVAGLAWLGLVGVAIRAGSSAGAERLPTLAAFALPLWALGVTLETVVAHGIAAFLARVRPDLLPGDRAASHPAEAA
jgi:cobalt/nickel transport system permease protein